MAGTGEWMMSLVFLVTMNSGAVSSSTPATRASSDSTYHPHQARLLAGHAPLCRFGSIRVSFNSTLPSNCQSSCGEAGWGIGSCVGIPGHHASRRDADRNRACSVGSKPTATMVDPDGVEKGRRESDVSGGVPGSQDFELPLKGIRG